MIQSLETAPLSVLFWSVRFWVGLSWTGTGGPRPKLGLGRSRLGCVLLHSLGPCSERCSRIRSEVSSLRSSCLWSQQITRIICIPRSAVFPSSASINLSLSVYWQPHRSSGSPTVIAHAIHYTGNLSQAVPLSFMFFFLYLFILCF